MRKYFNYIKESSHDDYPEGKVEIRDKPRPMSEKGETFEPQILDVETGEEFVPCTMVGLGYADFDDLADYNTSLHDVIAEKLDEQGIDHSLNSGKEE